MAIFANNIMKEKLLVLETAFGSKCANKMGEKFIYFISLSVVVVPLSLPAAAASVVVVVVVIVLFLVCLPSSQ